MRDEREEDGNDNRPEMSFYFSTDHEPDDELRNKREERFEVKEKSREITSLMKKTERLWKRK